MSWFYSVLSKNGDLLNEMRDIRFSSMENELISVNLPNSYTIAGGLKDTCLINNEENNVWLICGTGISNNNGNYYQLNKTHWHNRINDNSLNRDNLDGHFSILHLNKDAVKIYTDTFGIRKVYYYEDQNHIFLSSRMDWLVKHLNECKFNFNELSSFWNLQYILNTENTFIDDISTAGPEAEITISKGVIKKKSKLWTPSNCKLPTEEVISRLKSITTLPLNENRKPLLGLSGGMDCRTLLAFLNNEDKEKIALFSFGDDDNPDITVASDIANKLDLKHFKTAKKILPPHELIDELKEHTIRTEMHFPIDYFNIFSSFSNLALKGYTFIDGAAGEFMRNRTGNRLIQRFKLNPSIDPVPLMQNQLSSGRFSFFNNEINEQMKRGTSSALENAVNNLPSLKDITPYQWVDQFLIRYAFWGDSCGYLDSQIPNFMPFAQPSILDAIYNIPINEKVNNKINLSLIKKLSPVLSKFPLVREGTTAPYFSSYHNLISTVWTRASKKLGKQYLNRSPLIIVNYLQDILRDRLNSKMVKEYDAYNFNLLSLEFKQAIDNKKMQSAENILTWLSFDIWREVLENKGNI